MKKILIGVLVVILLAIGWKLGSPLFINERIEDPPPAEEMGAALTPAHAEGMWRDGDASHHGSGMINIYKNADGTALLRLKDFSVTNGPDLFVYLTKDSQPDSSDKVKAGFYSLGKLKGNKGNQNYAIPTDVNLEEYKGVAIYCRAFSVLFSWASLK